jgi:hypothetical protein
VWIPDGSAVVTAATGTGLTALATGFGRAFAVLGKIAATAAILGLIAAGLIATLASAALIAATLIGATALSGNFTLTIIIRPGGAAVRVLICHCSSPDLGCGNLAHCLFR